MWRWSMLNSVCMSTLLSSISFYSCFSLLFSWLWWSCWWLWWLWWSRVCTSSSLTCHWRQSAGGRSLLFSWKCQQQRIKYHDRVSAQLNFSTVARKMTLSWSETGMLHKAHQNYISLSFFTLCVTLRLTLTHFLSIYLLTSLCSLQ